MKRKVFACILFCITFSGMGQFVPQPLNYPGPGYWPFYYSIVDPDHMWIGTIHESGLPCTFSVKTNDGGNSWIFDSIPVPGVPWCVSICGWDTNTCFFVFWDNNSGPSIWKTTDGGTAWSNIITTQFAGSFINFYHAFSADTGIAMGDPIDGYYEIQYTYNGGATWTRVPSSDIPLPLTDEMGLNHSYSAIGNSVWFTTSKARCYRSNDRGQTWDVNEVFPGMSTDLGICFSTEQKGVIWDRSATVDPLVITIDGGITWNPVPFPAGYYIQDMSRVPGWEGGFMVTAYKTGMTVYFTPDLFNTLQIIQPNIISNGTVEFFDVATGWLGGGESGTNEIYKFDWILNSGKAFADQLKKLTILPNPSSGQALLKVPGGIDSKDPEIRISDMTGKEVAHIPLREKRYCSLDASLLANGVYLVALYSGNEILARERWIVTH